MIFLFHRNRKQRTDQNEWLGEEKMSAREVGWWTWVVTILPVIQWLSLSWIQIAWFWETNCVLFSNSGGGINDDQPRWSWSGKCYPMFRVTQVGNLFFKHLNWLASLNCCGTGNATHSPFGCLFLIQKGIGPSQYFFFHKYDCRPFL